jgi:alpha-mannosidase
MTRPRHPLYYTFGNHMHWVDMEWLWGYGVLPGSVRDMLYFCNETGAKGNINFDAIGYEKMASEAPEALAELREAIAHGRIEVVGASYGQPYGLFHGGESNARQRLYGARTVRRVLGVWPKTFWEEEFDFFPQLPQLLRGVNYEYASLFFQWTWHTPEVPREDLPAIWWEGMDGSRLLTAPRNVLNLHQWPEDFAGLLESPILRSSSGSMPVPGIVQWLELMPSPDWMCRAELMLPQLKALIAHPDFELRFATLSEYLNVAREHAQPRRYTMDDVFHGMSLGKNGDLFRRLSRQTEQAVLAAESLSAMAGLFGRPYPGWDVYPTWELDEAWRELLSAQHHDNDECEGLCGHVGQRSYDRSVDTSWYITEHTLQSLARRTTGTQGRLLVYNPLGWSRDAYVDGMFFGDCIVKEMPPYGYRVINSHNEVSEPSPIIVKEDDTGISLERGALKVVVDRKRGIISQLYSMDFPEGAVRSDMPLADFEMTCNGEVDHFQSQTRSGPLVGAHRDLPQILVTRFGYNDARITVTVSLAPEMDAVDVSYFAACLPRLDPGVHAALQTKIAVNLPNAKLIHDHPYGLSEIKANGVYKKKYPTGDWMTSPQVFEDVPNPFTALQLLDFYDGERGLLYLHDGSQGFLRESDTVRNILSMYDPWDEDYFVNKVDVRVRLVPHGKIAHAERWKLAQEFTRPVLTARSDQPGGDLPAEFGSVWCDAPNVVVSAFYREPESAGMYLENYAGRGMEFPYILRLVELNGEATIARVRLPGGAASAFRTNLLGEPVETLTATPAEAPLPGLAEWSQVEVKLRPYEIATLYLDLVLGRKQPRNLDAYRHVWATVHRV